jgi:hypothetical protein
MTMIGNQLGEESHLFMFEAKSHILSIAVKGEIQLGVVDVEIPRF